MQQQEASRNLKPEKPKITGPKPAIASKPKYVPPVNLRSQKVVQEDVSSQVARKTANDHKPVRHEETATFYTKGHNFEYRERPSKLCEPFTNYLKLQQEQKALDEPYKEKCDNFKGNSEMHGVLDATPKGPPSPSTVCCSILSNVGNDCCGIIANPNKKELEGKTITKMESIDSNSSDSGGFKEFVQRDMLAAAQGEFKTHQRKASQPELLDKPLSVKDQMSKSFTHQRQSSQPDEGRMSFMQNRQNFVASAQALEQFLPHAEYMCGPKPPPYTFDRPDDAALRYLPKMSVAQTSQMLIDRGEDGRPEQPKTKTPIIPHSQFQHTTKKLEELLAQRIEREKGRQTCLVAGESSQDVDQKMVIQKQIQQKLQADLQRTVKQIQEIQSIEYRLPQNRKWTEVGFFLISCT